MKTFEEALEALDQYLRVAGLVIGERPYDMAFAQYHDPIEAHDYAVMKDGRLVEIISTKSAGVVGRSWVLKEFWPKPGTMSQETTHMGDVRKPLGQDGKFPEVDHGFSYFLKVWRGNDRRF